MKNDKVHILDRFLISCVMLAFHRGDRIYSTLHQEMQPHSSLCGQSACYTDGIYSGNLNLIAVVFQSVAARVTFGIPMNNIRDKNINIELLGDTLLFDLNKQLMETGDSRQCVNLIGQYLLRRLYGFISDRFDRMNAVVQFVNDGKQDIKELSQTTCLGYKQFKRVFVEYTGLNPKEFLQIARFRKALYSLHAGKQIHLSQLTYDWGYSLFIGIPIARKIYSNEALQLMFDIATPSLIKLKKGKI